jgi:hypothetical protein
LTTTSSRPWTTIGLLHTGQRAPFIVTISTGMCGIVRFSIKECQEWLNLGNIS